MEVRSAIFYATIIIVPRWCSLPLFALPGMEGRLFVPLGVAFIVSTLASHGGFGDGDPGPVFYLLPRMKCSTMATRATWPGSRRATAMRSAGRRSARPRAWRVLAGTVAVLAPPPCPSFRPRFCRLQRRRLLVGLRLNPGVTLAESTAFAQQAEVLVGAGAGGHARWSPQRTPGTRRACRGVPCQRASTSV